MAVPPETGLKPKKLQSGRWSAPGPQRFNNDERAMASDVEIYNEELAATVLSHLSDGKSLRTIAKIDGMPCMVTIWKWIGRHEDFATRYAIAKQEAADAMVEDMHAICDDPTLDHNHKRIMVDTRKWIASKLKAKKYGDKVAVTDNEGGPLVISWGKAE